MKLPGLLVYVLGATIGASLGTFVGRVTSEPMVRRDFQREAVKHHAGRWIVSDDGEVSFEWLDKPQESR